MAVGLTLRLLRHGTTDWNVERRYAGWTDISLNAHGRAQIDELIFPPADIGMVLTSDLRRCVETAERAGLDAAPEPALREFDFGSMEGLTWDDLDSVMQSGILEYDRFVAPGGESVATFGARIESFVDDLPDGLHVLVTHGGVIHHLLRREGVERHITPGEWIELVITRR